MSGPGVLICETEAGPLLHRPHTEKRLIRQDRTGRCSAKVLFQALPSHSAVLLTQITVSSGRFRTRLGSHSKQDVNQGSATPDVNLSSLLKLPKPVFSSVGKDSNNAYLTGYYEKETEHTKGLVTMPSTWQALSKGNQSQPWPRDRRGESYQNITTINDANTNETTEVCK